MSPVPLTCTHPRAHASRLQLTAGLGVLITMNTYTILLGASSLALVVSFLTLNPNP